MDCTSKAILVLFDGIAQYLFKKSVHNLCPEYEREYNKLPLIITSLIRKFFIFQLHVNQYILDKQISKFTVSITIENNMVCKTLYYSQQLVIIMLFP